jgi:hypothetical protein
MADTEKTGVSVEQDNRTHSGYRGSRWQCSPGVTTEREHMPYERTETDEVVSELLSQVKAMDEGLAAALSDAICDQLTEFENRAVKQHGRQILAMIDGTLWASEGNVSAATEDESVLVRMFDRAAS